MTEQGKRLNEGVKRREGEMGEKKRERGKEKRYRKEKQRQRREREKGKQGEKEWFTLYDSSFLAAAKASCTYKITLSSLKNYFQIFLRYKRKIEIPEKKEKE